MIIVTPQIANAGCFRDHLREAVALNRERAPDYARLSNGRTEEISNKLIAGERLAIFGSYLFYNFDFLAEDYKRNGINIVCDEFVPMSLTPAFQAISTDKPDLSAYQSLPASEIHRDLRRALRSGFSQVKSVSAKWITQIEATEPRFNCMTRHLLESVARIASLAQGHMTKAESLGLVSPQWLSENMISSHMMMIQSAVEIDALAAPVQADGIAIICQDVPPIKF